MGGEDHHAALLTVPGQVFFELRHPLFVEGGEGFVEDPQRRSIQIQAGPRHPTIPGRPHGVGGGAPSWEGVRGGKE